MTPAEAVDYFKTQTALAAALTEDGWRCSPQAVGQWVENGKIPEGRQYQIQAITHGALKVGDTEAA